MSAPARECINLGAILNKEICMSNIINGRVIAVSEKPAKGGKTRHSIKVEGEWYGAGLDPLPCKKDTYVKFVYVTTKFGKDVEGHIEVLAAPGHEVTGRVEYVHTKNVM